MNNNLDLTDSVVFDLTVERNKTLDKTIQCLVKSGNTFGLFDFTPFSSSTLTVKTRPNDFYSPLVFSTIDGSLTFGDPGEFNLSKSAVDLNRKSGQYVYDMSLTSTAGTRGFLRGKFIIVDQGYGEVSNDEPDNSIVVKVINKSFAFTGNTIIVNTGETINPAFCRVVLGVEPDQPSDPFKRETIVPTGTTISGNTKFFWMFAVPEKVQANSISIKDVTNNVYLATGLTTNNYNNYNAGFAIVDIGNIPNIFPMTHIWQIELKDLNGQTIQSSQLKITSM